MNKKHLWLVGRIVVIGGNLLAFSHLLDDQTNFGIVAGLATGVLACGILFLWIRGHSVSAERFWRVDTPFWPMSKFPQSFWLWIGLAVTLASAVNLIIHFGDPRGMQLFSGLLMVGIGFAAAAILSGLFPVKGRR